jgi:uncharacterized membrane protein YvbJ
MFCPHCGNESETDSIHCSSCGDDLAPHAAHYRQNRIVRPRTPRMLAGIANPLRLG